MRLTGLKKLKKFIQFYYVPLLNLKIIKDNIV